jgi:hypothetical protein
MRFPFNPAPRAALICVLQKPTANEIASIRNCATRNKDNLDEGKRRCLFNLVALPCIKKGHANESAGSD